MHAKNETSGIPGENSIKSFHVDGRHYGMEFFSQTTDQNYNDIVFTNRFKKDSWDVITLEIGAGLAKLLRMESEGIYKKYWSASDWSFKEATLTRVSFVIKNPKTLNSKLIKYNVVEDDAMEDIVPYRHWYVATQK